MLSIVDDDENYGNILVVELFVIVRMFQSN